MRYHLLILVAAFALALSLPTTAVVPNWRDVVEHTVRVESANGGGTGVPVRCEPMIDGNWFVTILTAAHVIQGEDLADWVIATPEQVFGAPHLLAVHPTADAALLGVSSQMPLHCPPLHFPDLYTGERVWVIGYPALVKHRVITDGWVGGPGYASAEVFPGNSGGPVVDSSGRLRGIVLRVGAYGHPMDPSFIHHDMGFLQLAAIKEWLDRIL